VPTLDEQGLKGFNIAIWHGFYAPKGTPKAVIDKLSSALQEGLKGSAREDALQRTRHRPGRSEARHTEALRAASQGRDRQVGADHQGCGRLRRLI
jgi:tripartite-type tricarboxylate transporter receptor subunit TctC